MGFALENRGAPPAHEKGFVVSVLVPQAPISDFYDLGQKGFEGLQVADGLLAKQGFKLPTLDEYLLFMRQDDRYVIALVSHTGVAVDKPPLDWTTTYNFLVHDVACYFADFGKACEKRIFGEYGRGDFTLHTAGFQHTPIILTQEVLRPAVEGIVYRLGCRVKEFKE